MAGARVRRSRGSRRSGGRFLCLLFWAVFSTSPFCGGDVFQGKYREPWQIRGSGSWYGFSSTCGCAVLEAGPGAGGTNCEGDGSRALADSKRWAVP